MKNVTSLSLALVALNLAGFAYVGCGGGDDSSPAQTQNDAGGGGSDSGSTDSGASGDSSAGDSGGSFVPQTFSVGIDKVASTAQTEHTYCVTKKLGNSGTVHAGTLHTVISGGTNVELAVYKVSDTTESPTPTECSPLSPFGETDGGATALTIAQKTDETLQFPTGDAFTLADHQMIRIELHAIDVDGTGFGATASFTTSADADFKNEVGMMFGGTSDINLPPGTGTVSEQLPVPDFMNSSDLLFLSGHQHLLGTGVIVDYGMPSPPPTTSIYDDSTASFDNPTLTALPAGQTLSTADVFAFTCNWNNVTGNTVLFGVHATDEQCYFRAHFAPATTSSQICIHTNQGGGSGQNVCCPSAGAMCSGIFP